MLTGVGVNVGVLVAVAVGVTEGKGVFVPVTVAVGDTAFVVSVNVGIGCCRVVVANAIGVSTIPTDVWQAARVNKQNHNQMNINMSRVERQDNWRFI